MESNNSARRVLVVGTSDRLWKIADPLDEAGDVVSTLQITGKESIRPLIHQIKTGGHDIVITDALGRAGAVVYLICLLCRTPCALRIRGDALTERPSVLVRNMKNRSFFSSLSYLTSTILTITLLIFCRKQIFVSEYCRDESRMRFFSSSDAVVIPTPLRNLPEEAPNVKEGKTLLAVTNFNFLKKTMGLLNALGSISRSLDQNPAWTFKIAGGGSHLDLVKSAVDDMESIEVLGHVDGIDALYEEADLFVHFSHLDAYPSTVIEASAHRLPIIANTGVGMSNQIIHGENGYLVDLSNNEDVTFHICKLMDSEPRRREMGRNARSIVEENNSTSRIGDQLHDYICSVTR